MRPRYDPTFMDNRTTSRVLFARIGWMNFYRGIVPGDPELIGGGAYNETEIGSEVLNFAPHVGRVYGFVQGIRQHALTIERIDAAADGQDRVGKTLVIFVSRRPHQRGQVIIGWYQNAVVYRQANSDPRPKFGPNERSTSQLRLRTRSSFPPKSAGRLCLEVRAPLANPTSAIPWIEMAVPRRQRGCPEPLTTSLNTRAPTS
jgi:hypothetical protein